MSLVWLKIGAIIVATLMLIIPTIFTFKGQKSFWETQIDNLANRSKNISIGNETLIIPQQNNTWDLKDWIAEIPVGDILRTVSDGSIATVNWISRGVTGFLNIFLQNFGIKLPDIFGFVIVVAVGLMMLAKSLEGVMNFSFTASKYAAFIAIGLVLITFMFVLLGKI